MSGWRVAESVLVLLPVRLALAGAFGLAAVLKLSDPQEFAFAVKAFRVLDADRYDHLLVLLSFGIPWAELLAAVLLVLGMWTRSAAVLLGLMLTGFTAGLLSLIARGIDTECACFGSLDFVCEGAVGWCHIGRNAVILVLALLVAWRGGGVLSVDAARIARSERGLDPGRDEG